LTVSLGKSTSNLIPNFFINDIPISNEPLGRILIDAETDLPSKETMPIHSKKVTLEPSAIK